MIKVNRRAHSSEDRAGDPLDGLVNMFDIGIVLSLGFLLAALSSLQLSKAITDKGLQQPKNQISVPKDSQVKQVPADDKKVIGNGKQIGRVYQLDDGRLVYVVPSPSSGPSAGSSTAPSASPSTAP